MGTCHYCGKHVDTGVPPEIEGSGLVSCGCISERYASIAFKKDDVKCPECGTKTRTINIPPSIWEPDGKINKCPKCGWNDL